MCKKYFLYIFFLLINGCITPTPHSIGVSSTVPDLKPEILFLFCRLEKDTVLHKTRVYLTDKKITEGHLKETPRKNEELPCLEYILFSSNKKNPESGWLEHPLFKKIESYSENGIVQIQKLELKEATFMIRLNMTSELQYITLIEKTIKSTDTLSTIKIR